MKLSDKTFLSTAFPVLLGLLCWSLPAWGQPPLIPAPGETIDAVILVEPPERRAYLTFGLDRVGPLQRELMGIELWQYVASLIYILLAFLVSKLLDLLIRARLARKLEGVETGLTHKLLQLLHGPVKLISFVILLHIGLRVFAWPDWLSDWISMGLQLVVALSVTYMGIKAIDLLINYWQERDSVRADRTLHDQLFPIVRNSLKAFVLIVSVLVTTQNLGLNVTGLIASLSIGGLALGLAAQDTLSNLFGAIAIFLDKPFRIGERIQLDGVDGTVEYIGLRSTRVRNLDGHLITVPNKTMGNATITNVTLRPNIRTLINIGITYGTTVEKTREALQILDQVYRAHPMTHDVWISFNKFADYSLNIFIVHWWNSTVFKDYLAGMQEMNLTIKERFDAAGIEFAFPTSTVHLKQDSDWVLGHSNAGIAEQPPKLEERPAPRQIQEP